MTEYAGIITRVSTAGQLDNTSPDEQLRRCREYCAAHNYTVVAEKIEAISGAMVMARTGFRELCELANAGQLSVIVADIPDRLGRGDAIAKLEFMAQMYGARIEYAQPGRDTSTVEGLIQHSAEQMVSGIERLNIRRRTKNGKIEWAKRGRVIAAARRPYGYSIKKIYDDRNRKIDCTLEPIEAEAKIVRQIFDWCVTNGMTTTEIARRLTEEGVPRISDYDEAHKRIQEAASANRRHWHNWPRATIASIIRNPLYRGEWQYGRRATRRIDTPDGIRQESVKATATAIGVSVPRTVSDEIWYLAQERLDENARKFRRPTNKVYLLRSRIRCALCGAKYYCISSSRGPRYYTCGNHHYDTTRGTHCPSGAINSDKLEAIVWKVVCEELMHPERLIEGAKAHQAETGEKRKIVEAALLALESLNSNDQAKLDRLLDLYAGGGLKKAAYTVKCKDIEDQMKKREDERADLRQRLAGLPAVTPEFEQALRAFSKDVADRLGDDVSLEQRMSLLDLLVVECVYNGMTKEMNISGIFGTRIVSTSSM